MTTNELLRRMVDDMTDEDADRGVARTPGGSCGEARDNRAVNRRDFDNVRPAHTAALTIVP